MILRPLQHSSTHGFTTWGCMWKQGQCIPGTGFLCTGESGQNVPIQTRVTAWWPDGSIKWTAHTGACALLGQKIEVIPSSSGISMPEGIRKTETPDAILLHNGLWEITIPRSGSMLVSSVRDEHRVLMEKAVPELILEEPSVLDGNPIRIEKRYHGSISEVVLEESGPLQTTIRYTGTHTDTQGETRMPFIIRMRINAMEPRLHFTHTFLYDGDENRDYLKGLGINFELPMSGEMYNRHIKFTGDHGVMHEVMASLTSWRPRMPREIYVRQMQGEIIRETGAIQQDIDTVMQATPYWSCYDICQDSAEHFSIRKKLAPDNCCYIDALHGRRAAGGLAFGSPDLSMLATIRDFWEKYPSGYTVEGLDSDKASCHLWFWHPSAPVMDFRHYANRGYNQVCYEGYDYKGASPYGIACTNECTVTLLPQMIPEDRMLLDSVEDENNPVLYVASPEAYHELHAFGYWSLPSRETEMENWLEDQLDRAFAFYAGEVDRREWYGMFNYGDIMHTYDSVRHQWKYDVGGYAWDNTELVPTLWLWTAFLRTGRADIFRMAEKLTRHASEVDVYHFGPYKGLGSRHNVRHWGCPCKEARIAMAHHHRVYYYLTGDLRLEDIFDELKDNELSFLNKDPLGDFYRKDQMVYPSHARSGPDWSSLCSNWLTQWERTNDDTYRNKMLVGMEDIRNTPLRLVSGPDFEFDPATLHLRYIGERATGGTHLQICMGAPSVWTEMADLLQNEEWNRMLAEYGRFYFLPEDRQQKESGGLIGKREFSLPFMAASIGAYAAAYLKDNDTAERTWAVLLHTLLDGQNTDGFASVTIPDAGNQALLEEIPWITTNFVAQFGINTIMTLEWIRDRLPHTLKEANELVRGLDPAAFHKA